MVRVLRFIRTLSYKARLKLYTQLIAENSLLSGRRKKLYIKEKSDPLFFLHTRKYDFVPSISITHRITFDRFKPFDFMKMDVQKGKTQCDSNENILLPPKEVHGMKVLDRSKFDKVIKVPCMRVRSKDIQKFKNVLNKCGLKMPNMSPVVGMDKSDPDYNTYKLLLLNPLKANFEEILTISKIEEKGGSLEEYDLKLTYKNWDFYNVVNSILPEGVTVSGFSTIGHIAHFNLRDEVLPYKTLIGEVLLDKLANVKTVVNKLDTIDNTYRNFKMEVLAGEDTCITQAKENGCVFEMDFSKVYWNSRLGTEHERIVKLVKEGDLVFDVFAGIGPFAIPAAKKKALVYANDLNPASYESMLKNVKLNKITAPVHCFNMDGRDFIKTVLKEEFVKFYKDKENSIYVNPQKVHIVMNLPAIAVTFLDAFKSLLDDVTDVDLSNVDDQPTVHCYSFTNLEEAEAKWDGDKSLELKQRVMGFVGTLKEDDITLRFVRDVAPNKEMMCAMFKLTPAILFGNMKSKETYRDNGEQEEPPKKIQKVAESQ